MVAEPDRSDVGRGFATPPPHAFPLREGKIHPPELQDDILKRDRLLDWLGAKINRRVVFVVAEAGFGKTTLLADFVRRTHVRTVWYRLDEEETDALVFLRYLVAACRTTDPSLLPRSNALLTEPSSSPVGWEAVLTTLLTELPPLATDPTAIFFDDYHVAERLPAVRHIVEQLIARAPERLSLIFASRRTPPLSVARLRARDELAELTREELCFEPTETERLFRETYRQPLETDVLRDLQTRTEGWPASLQLVKQALARRTPAEIRAFVRTLSGGEGTLYDYLAEEVVAELPEELRFFLVRAALNEEVEAEVAGPAVGLSAVDAAHLIGDAERLGLLSRSRVSTRAARFHPLVRDFLLARLRTEMDEAAIADLHRALARLEEPRSWRRAARHWGEAGDRAEVRRVIESGAWEILGSGEYEFALETISAYCADEQGSSYFAVIRSRHAFSRGDLAEGQAHARHASELLTCSLAPPPRLVALVALNDFYAATICAGDAASATPPADVITPLDGDDEPKAIAEAARAMSNTARDGAFDEAERAVSKVASVARASGHRRNEGIAYVNLAGVSRAEGRHEDSLDSARRAIELLEEAGTPDELASAHLYRGCAYAHIGNWAAAEADINTALGISRHPDALLQAGEIHALYGDPSKAEELLHECDRAHSSETLATIAQVFRYRLSPPDDPEAANQFFRRARSRWVYWCGHASAVLATWAYAASVSGFDGASDIAEEAAEQASRQGANYYASLASLIRACLDGPADINRALHSLDASQSGYLTLLAELLLQSATELDQAAFELLTEAACRHPVRWRFVARSYLDQALEPKRSLAAARILDFVGTEDDVPRLRAMARLPEIGMPALGQGLIRRLAPIAFVEDLGPIRIRVGDRDVPSPEIRRKVLSLLCFLLTRDRLSATCEQVLDALWPGTDETVGMNSLNQTVYFLRRVFEPGYSEHTSPGYVRHDGEMLCLDPVLIQSRSARCRDALRRLSQRPSFELIAELQREYTGRFALDFAYDEWSQAYREHLHAAYLSVVERAVALDTSRGEYERAISMAHQALVVDPDADEVELSLIRLYKLTGAYSAASGQYAHYASVVREQVGVEPLSLDSL